MLRLAAVILVFSFFARNLYGSPVETENSQDIGTSQEYDELESEEKQKLNVLKNFQLIGSRHFYIEKESALDWFAAADMCSQLGGQLATIRSNEELQLIVPKLKWDSAYWLDLTDLSEEGRFVSTPSDEPAAFLNWRKGQPDNYNNNEHCVSLINYYIYDCICESQRYFICEAEIEV